MVEIGFYEVKYQVELITGENNFLKLDNIGMVNLFQGLDFPKLETLIPSGILLLEFLNGDNLIFGSDGLEDDAKGPVSHGLDDFVLFHCCRECRK